MKKLILVFLLAIPAFGQSFGGRSSSDVRVVPPYKLCFGEDNGQDVCIVQTSAGNASVSGILGTSGTRTPSLQTAASYPFVAADATKLTVFNNAGGVSATISAPTTTGFGSGKIFSVVNGGSGNVTLTCSCNIVLNGTTSGSITLTQGDFVNLYSDGVSTYYGEGGSFALTTTSNTYASGTTQFFPSSIPNPSLAIGFATSDIATTGPLGGVWFNQNGCGNVLTLNFWDGNFAHCNLNEQNTPADMANGVTGTGQTVLSSGAQLSNDDTGVMTGKSYTTGPSSFDFLFYYYNSANVVTGFTAAANYVPANHLAEIMYDDNNNGQFLLGESNQAAAPITRTIATGTAAMTTAGIGAGACGTTVTVAATNTLTTDVIDVAGSAVVTSGNGGLLILNKWPTANNVNFAYCNPGSGTVTPTAQTINWKVLR